MSSECYFYISGTVVSFIVALYDNKLKIALWREVCFFVLCFSGIESEKQNANMERTLTLSILENFFTVYAACLILVRRMSSTELCSAYLNKPVLCDCHYNICTNERTSDVL